MPLGLGLRIIDVTGHSTIHTFDELYRWSLGAQIYAQPMIKFLIYQQSVGLEEANVLKEKVAFCSVSSLPGSLTSH